MGARLLGAPGPQPPRAAPVSAGSRGGLGNWCVQLPCPPPGQGQVRDWRGSARLRNCGAPGEAEKRKFLSRVPEQCRSPKEPELLTKSIWETLPKSPFFL